MSHRQGSSTEKNIKISHREDGKETAQGQVSHSQSSSTENNRKIASREDRKEIGQGQLSERQSSTTGDRKIDMAQRRKCNERQHQDL